MSISADSLKGDGQVVGLRIRTFALTRLDAYGCCRAGSTQNKN